MQDSLETGQSGSDEENNTGWLPVIRDWISAIPNPLHAPLLKAASRLLRGLVDVPAAALSAKAEDITHKEEMRKLFRAALTNQAIDRLPEKQELADRALDYFIADTLGKQQNREAVLASAIDDLKENPATTEDKQNDLDDDWLTAFSRYAADASTERLQKLYGRILAGEIRSSGSYSLFTLDFLSKLSSKDARMITNISPYVIGDKIIVTPKIKKILTFQLMSDLGSLNILTSTSIGGLNAIYTMTTQKLYLEPNQFGINGRFGACIVANDHIFLAVRDDQADITLNCIVLTNIGKEILRLHIADFDPTMLTELADHLKTQNTDFFIGEITAHNGDKVEWRNLRMITPTPPSDAASKA